MLKEERQQIILKEVEVHNRVLLTDLAEQLEVSVDTVRRDVKTLDRKQKLGARDIALIRLDQIFPFPHKEIRKILKKYHNNMLTLWVQEEPENMGGWNFVRSRIASLVQKHIKYIGREAAASPATGFHNIYKSQQAAILEEAVGPAP
mgnify:CR=1 FL=1